MRSLLVPLLLVASWQVGCVGVPRDDRPQEVKAAAEKNPAVSAGDSEDNRVRAAYLERIVLRNIRAQSFKDLAGERKAIVEGEVKNTGDRSVDEVQITMYFLDAAGARVHENTYNAVPNLLNNSGPLKPNYARGFSGGFDVPSDWAGKVEVKVTDVKFSAASATPKP